MDVPCTREFVHVFARACLVLAVHLCPLSGSSYFFPSRGRNQQWRSGRQFHLAPFPTFERINVIFVISTTVLLPSRVVKCFDRINRLSFNFILLKIYQKFISFCSKSHESSIINSNLKSDLSILSTRSARRRNKVKWTEPVFFFFMAAICSIRIISKRRSGSVFLSSANVSFFHFPPQNVRILFLQNNRQRFCPRKAQVVSVMSPASNLDKSRWKSRGIVSLSRTCWKSIRRGYATCFHCASKLWTKHKFS